MLWQSRKSQIVKRATRFLQAEGPIIALISTYIVVSACFISIRMGQDSWLDLLAGREVLHHGLPGVDTLAYMTQGVHWIDQQWLAQLVAYSIFCVGGVKLFLTANIVLLASTLTMLACLARKAGASTRCVAWLLLATMCLVGFPGARAQSLAFPLFVILLILLIKDARAPSTRIFWTIPLLALWGNLHGSVVLGVLLVMLRAGLMLFARRSDRSGRAKAALLFFAAPAALFATPYATSIVGYYHSILANPTFGQYITEWLPTVFTPLSAPFFLCAGGAIWLLGRRRKDFTAFEWMSLLLLIVMSLAATRYIYFLGLALIPLLARPASKLLRPAAHDVSPKFDGIIGAASVALACLIVPLVIHQPLSPPFPAAPTAVITKEAAHNPQIKIFADLKYTDWLLFSNRALRGHLAYDARLELLTGKQMQAIVEFYTEIGPTWTRAAKGADLVVIDRARYPHLGRDFLAAVPGSQLIFRSANVVIIKTSQPDTA